MKITEIEYGKVQNDGNYGNDRLTLRAQLDEGEDAVACVANLAKTVNTLLEAVARKSRHGYDYDDDQDAGLG